MSVIIVSGSCGLVGSETVTFFCQKGYDVVGIDNNMRKVFFGIDGSIAWNKRRLKKQFKQYRHYDADIRDEAGIRRIFKKYGRDTVLIVHAAAQPSHDWAVREPKTDFSVNATGTLVLLEAFRQSCPGAVFVYTSTNKVYGDRPNSLSLFEQEKRFELPVEHQYYKGIDESMSVDTCLHSLFGASKLSADLIVQEYGRYFGLKTGIFRCGCLTGPLHSGAQLHGFLSYLVKCCLFGRTYHIFGYKGKQVRDNIHSYDLVNAFYHYMQQPRCAEVYNMGGARFANVSLLEAVELCQQLTGKKLKTQYGEANRIGDHMWWISDVTKFKSHFPGWKHTYTVEDTVRQIIDAQKAVAR